MYNYKNAIATVTDAIPINEGSSFQGFLIQGDQVNKAWADPSYSGTVFIQLLNSNRYKVGDTITFYRWNPNGTTLSATGKIYYIYKGTASGYTAYNLYIKPPNWDQFLAFKDKGIDGRIIYGAAVPINPNPPAPEPSVVQNPPPTTNLSQDAQNWGKPGIDSDIDNSPPMEQGAEPPVQASFIPSNINTTYLIIGAVGLAIAGFVLNKNKK